VAKWLWYANGAIIVSAVLVLIIGLLLLPESQSQAKAVRSDSAAGRGDKEAEKSKAAGVNGQEDSALVAAVRLFVKRWEPKVPKLPKLPTKKAPPKKPPPKKPAKPEKKLGSLTVTIGPEAAAKAKAKWRVDEGPWRDSGATAKKIEVGSHKVSFHVVKNWEKPKPITVEITKDEVTSATGTYTKVKPPGPKFVLEGTLIVGESPGEAWIKVPKVKAAKPYTAGQMVKEYKIIRIGDGVVELSRDGFEYSIEVPRPKPAKVGASTAPDTPDIPEAIRDVEPRRKRGRLQRRGKERDRDRI